MQVTTTLHGSHIVNGGILVSEGKLETIIDKVWDDMANPNIDTKELEAAVARGMAKSEKFKAKRAAKKAKKLKITR